MSMVDSRYSHTNYLFVGIFFRYNELAIYIELKRVMCSF